VTVQDYRAADGLVPAGETSAQSSYDLPLSAWLPPGVGPFPVVICGHGLGGDRDSCEGIAGEAAGNGLALIGVDAVEHGDHPGRTEADLDLIEPLMIFSIRLTPPGINGLKLRDNFRQSAWDKLQLVEAIRAGVDFDGDGILDLDGERIGYAGVSLGGIMGAEPMALSPHIKAGLMVVGGARVTQIIEDSPTFSILIDLMKPPGTDGGEVDRAFPLLQTMMDPGDPMTWAPQVQNRGDGAASPDVMLMAAFDDQIVPNSTNDLLAMAFAAPGVGSEVWPVDGVSFSPGSMSGNGPGGASLGLVQFATVHEAGVEKVAEHDNVHDSDEGLAAIEAFFTPVFEAGGHGVVTDPDE
jgi:dienelactone hydrolase